MKRSYKFIAIICLLIAIFTSIGVAFAAENNLEICEHTYKYSKTADECFVYACTECGDTITKAPNKVLGYWNNSVINKTPENADNGEFIDVVPDSFINAKDFAKILHTKNYGY